MGHEEKRLVRVSLRLDGEISPLLESPETNNNLEKLHNLIRRNSGFPIGLDQIIVIFQSHCVPAQVNAHTD